ncbi:hypothetical protein WJU16_17940 [Chitinophaga pollutisoli]|uniref:Lipoprotein n=1 Tax=Chitinophaga pollutisoli TaxID=3133966 RepID=A0ABZ2YJH7_9BACT
MKYKLQLFLIAFMATVSCNKDSKPPKMEDALVYSETQCADPWAMDVPRTGKDFNKQLKTWLHTKTKIAILTAKRDVIPEKIRLCAACTCLTGNTIYVWVPDGSEQAFLDMGFKRASELQLD